MFLIEVQEVVPAPELEPEVKAHYRRFEWILYLLRRQHLGPADPAGPVLALHSAGAHLLFAPPYFTAVLMPFLFLHQYIYTLFQVTALTNPCTVLEARGM